MSYFPITQIGYSDSASIDAFARLRVSEPYTVFDSKQVYTNNSLLWSEKTNGVGASIAYNSDKSESQLTVGTVSGEYAIRQTKQYMVYQPGKSHMILITGNAQGAKANVVKRTGYFDDNDGVFFELDGLDFNVVLRSSTSGSPVDTQVAQASWNIDPMDGTGPSGVLLDVTKCQIMFFDLEWLGVGRVRCGWVIDGIPVYCHQFLNANNITEAYMKTATLPVRFEIRNSGVAASSSTIQAICCCVLSEGGYNPKARELSIDNGITAKTFTSTLTPLIQIRLNSSYIRGSIDPISIEFMGTTTGDFYRWALILNPTVTGGTAANWQTISHSIAQYDIAATGAVTLGTIIASGYFASGGGGAVGSNNVKNTSLESSIKIAADIDGTSDVLVLAAQTITGSGDLFGSIHWRESV